MNKADLTRWSWVEIDRGALRRNTRAYKNLLNPRQRLCCVVKADAYGHGAVECAKIMYSAGADMFAVATVNEGVELRQGGITKPILILSEPPIEAIPTLLEFDIMPSVYTSDFALAYGECAVAAGKVGKYHLAIETGMNRIGVHYTQVLDFVRGISFHRGIQCDGVFTHFATADEPSGWDYKLQCQRFTEAVQAIKDAGFECGIVHCANTPSSMLDPSMHFDMIRAGVGLYGIQICTLPIGYADGLSRTLSNRMDVLYRGERIRQVGNICMDQFMVAIQSNPAHEIPEAEHGDEMIIVGRDGDAEITMDEMARLRGTINYEVACGFGMRLDKVYV